MKKEKIHLCDITDGDSHMDIDDTKGWSCVQAEQVGYDAEKNMIDWECIIKRLSDGKFFKFEYTQYNYNGSDLQNEIATECIAKTKTITYYE